MKLFFDTETTGLPLFRQDFTDAGQPHIVQLGAILCDENRRVVGELNVIVQPDGWDGWTVPDEAAKVHGITTEIAKRYGVPIVRVMKMFASFSWESLSTARMMRWRTCMAVYYALNKSVEVAT